MGLIVHKANSRGYANHGWLKSFHTFSFAGYHNTERIHFGLLRVLNDDTVAAGMGFGKHPHDNMEIISIPLKGALAHKDSTGRSEIIKTNDVQIMGAGSGIAHSEMNASVSEEVNFLQIWVLPKKKNIEPRYEQKTFDPAKRVNQWQVIVSPEENNEGVWINQDAWFSLTRLKAETTLNYLQHLHSNGTYVFAIDGEVNVEGETLQARDGMGLLNTNEFSITALTDAELLVIEVPIN
ncbi:MAG: pirin family protein [Sphingobacteriales bacterium]|nr:pirin family protein [Sphingobacteriales bacterium]